MTMSIEEAIFRLKYSNLQQIVEDTGCSYTTISNIKKGITRDPSYSTMLMLDAFFRGLDDELTSYRQ